MALSQFLNKEEQKVRSLRERLAEWINIEILETDTIWLFNSEGIIYSQYADGANTIIKRNEDYATICKEISINSEFTKEVKVQTSNPLTIHQEIQCEPIIMKDVGCWSSFWDLYDSIKPQNKEDDVIASRNKRLQRNLNLIENLLSLNIHQSVLVTFRNSVNQIESDSSSEQLWVFSSPLIDNKPVTSLVLNKQNEELLCAGYGNFDCDNRTTGLICCWSLTNLLHPKCSIICPSNVLCVDFSEVKPNELACGLSNGLVMVFDIYKSQRLWNSGTSNLYHFGPIWGVRWKQATNSHVSLKQNMKSQEHLFTLSEDGSVCRWTLEKNNQMTKKTQLCLTKEDLKLGNDSTESLTKKEPLWDFDFKDSILNSYLVSTENGNVHLCSALHSDKVLKTYSGHKGPVYKICISPFVTSVFLSCGSDWTIKVWNETSSHSKPLISLQTSMCPIYDISWSPHSSTVFANVYPNRLDIWDLNINLLEPILSEKSGWKETFTSVLFSKTSNAVYVGSDVGKIYVYAIKGFNRNQDEALIKIIERLEDHRRN